MKPKANLEHGFDTEVYRQTGIDLVRSHLDGVDYPSNKQHLIDHALRQNAGRYVVSLLERLPDRNYQSAGEVSGTLDELK